MADKLPRGVKPCTDSKKHGRHRWGDEKERMWLCDGKS